ncbi:Domain of unknown function (DUF4355) [Micromonospora sediminicola]|uniref:Uncharacterized protein n=1 Tax=Micromonospora sediminicola TaxID=946078 RepID=A0A1A9B491_9ACTN|nr:hypothetical protein [Micromonospora sediminicola]SBT63933.1 Domain of unknown function (DUF4355) [Micromonospora sediminicola]
MTHLPTHPHLRHPRTGDPLRALGRTRSGRLIWPQLGAAPDPPAPAPGPGQPPADPGTGAPPANPGTGSGGGQPPADPAPTGGDPQDKPLGPAGEKALREERVARIALEKRFSRLAAAFGDGDHEKGKSDLELLNERFDSYEKELAEERRARSVAEVAAAKGLTPQQAARLQGSTREELEADADALLQLFPGAPAGPRNPAPDPTQGTRGNQPADLEALIAAAQAAGNVREVIRLQKQKLTVQQ